MQPRKTFTYAGIGSRETPEQVFRLMVRCAARLEELGYTLRSGGADGADTAFEQGCSKKEIFLPWRGFNGRRSSLHSVCEQAQSIAADVHPRWDKLSPAARKLMARNTYQVLGQSLNDPVDFVLCWTPDGAESEQERGHKTGGTGQAIALASRYGIPIFNMQREGALLRLKKFLG